ncbi:MAG: hypothetical protein LBD73_03325 [Deferribacteraceae bacterium]|jgi:hypothetical protein|nr:hypothetical protein [Deferribacteraceae bacterium]
MHFVFLAEDQSSANSLKMLIPQLIGDGDTFAVHSYHGGGRDVSKFLKTEPRKQIFFARLPELISG